MDGFIIVNYGWREDDQLRMGYRTFSPTVGGAWRHHINHPDIDRFDFTDYVQRWSNKGYGPKEVSMNWQVAHTCPVSHLLNRRRHEDCH